MNEHEMMERDRFAAAAPTDAGMISDEEIFSRWSQKHVAYICGHGTFGVNNMLISDKGCVGRYFSVVANIPVLLHRPVTGASACGKCVVGLPCSYIE